MTELCHPERLVTIDRRGVEEAPQALFDYIAERQLGEVLRPVYGVNQADTVALRAVLDREFGDDPIDLVIDDASHQLAETRASFNVVFPRVRAGGVYLIEDWAWGHKPGVVPTTPEEIELSTRSFWPNGPPLTVIAFELIMAFATHHDLIGRIEIDEHTIHVWRGDAALDPASFDLATSYEPGGIRIQTDDRDW